jgi:oxysterol-binding protein 1
VGKDISKFSVPVYMNEPISMIQKIVELMEYENLLVRANVESDSKLRLGLIGAFGAAQYACSANRMSKPFNPILGETYEYVCPKFKYVGEQVSHHPPISAAFATSESYDFWM